jgi:ribosome-binding protein aMBF1 (putative translation factor)
VERILPRLPAGLVRRKPRSFAEWRALRRWKKPPAWEIEPAGYLLRTAREATGFSQRQLAERLGCSQQAIAQSERWRSNPTVEFMRRWAAACGSEMRLAFRRTEGRSAASRTSDV